VYGKLPQHYIKADIGTAVFYKTNNIEYAMQVMDNLESADDFMTRTIGDKEERSSPLAESIIEGVNAFPFIGINARAYIPILINPIKNAFDDTINFNEEVPEKVPVPEPEPVEEPPIEEKALTNLESLDLDEFA
jgi:hypothetical protein